MRVFGSKLRPQHTALQVNFAQCLSLLALSSLMLMHKVHENLKHSYKLPHFTNPTTHSPGLMKKLLSIILAQKFNKGLVLHDSEVRTLFFYVQAVTCYGLLCSVMPLFSYCLSFTSKVLIKFSRLLNFFFSPFQSILLSYFMLFY